MAKPQDEEFYTELRKRVPPTINVDFSTLFIPKEKKKTRRQDESRVAFLMRHTELLGRLLEPSECIRFLTFAVQNLAWEAMLGSATYWINNKTVIVTDRRILVVQMKQNFWAFSSQATSKGNAEDYVNQIPLASITRMKTGSITGLIQLTVAKQKLNFVGLPKIDAKHFEKLVTVNAQASGAMQYLCPRCFMASDQLNLICPRCAEPVKSPKIAGWRSLILPGLGDYYLGHRGLAVIEMLGVVYAWVIVGGLAASVSYGDGVTAEEAVVLSLAAALIIFVHGVDAIVTYHQGKKGQYSLDRHLPTGQPFDALAPTAPNLSVPSNLSAQKPEPILSLKLAFLAAALIGAGAWLGVRAIPEGERGQFMDGESGVESRSVPVSSQDLRLVVTIEELLPWLEGYSVDKTKIKTEKYLYNNGGSSIYYQYQDTALILQSFTAVLSNDRDAQAFYREQVTKLKDGYDPKSEFVDRKGLFRYGDELTPYDVVYEGERVAQTFSLRVKKTVHVFLLAGVTFSDDEAYRELFNRLFQELDERSQPLPSS